MNLLTLTAPKQSATPTDINERAHVGFASGHVAVGEVRHRGRHFAVLLESGRILALTGPEGCKESERDANRLAELWNLGVGIRRLQDRTLTARRQA